MNRKNWLPPVPRGFYGKTELHTSDSDSDIEECVRYPRRMFSGPKRAEPEIFKTEDGIDVNTLYISFKNANNEFCSDIETQKIFEKFGKVKSVRFHNKETNQAIKKNSWKVATVVRNRVYGFISFETCEDAARCLVNRHKLKDLFLIAKADSWHQDAYQKTVQTYMGQKEKKEKQEISEQNGAAGPSSSSANAATEICDSQSSSHDAANDDNNSMESNKDNLAGESPETMDIRQLNDDCLMLIFDQLDLMDLIALEKTCDRFASIVHNIYKRYKSFDFDEELIDKDFLTLLDAKIVLTDVGPFMHSLTISQNRFLQAGVRVLNLIPRYCPNLKELEMRDFTFNSKMFNSFKTVFENLERLSLISCGIDDSIERILSRATNLQRLDLSMNSEITGTCLKGVKNLKYINLDSCQNIQGKPFSQFAAKNKTLEYLNINCCSRLTVHAIKSIVSNMSELSHLVCNNLYDNVDPASLALLAKLPKLTKIQVQFNGYSPIDPILEGLVESNQLEHLNLSDGIFTTVDYNLICGLTRLTELKLNYKLDFTDQHLAKLGVKGNFVELHIAGCTSVTDKHLLEFIKMNPQLKLLNISYCQISEGLIFSAIDILKKQAVQRDAAFSNGHKLKMMVGQTSIYPVINENNLIQNNRHLLEISFEYTDGFYGDLDGDDMDDDIDDDEDFMGYENEEHLWGLDYDSELDMYQQFYDSDDDVSRFFFEY